MHERGAIEEIELGMHIENRLKKGRSIVRSIPDEFEDELMTIKKVVNGDYSLELLDKAIEKRFREERCKPHYVKLEQELKEEEDGLIYPEPWLGPDWVPGCR